MDKTTVLAIVSDFRDAVQAAGVTPLKIILFGSYAAGTQRPDSDIDLVVISDDFEGMDYWQRIDILAGAIYQVFKPIEAVAMTPQEWQDGDSMIVNYARDGEVVFKRP